MRSLLTLLLSLAILAQITTKVATGQEADPSPGPAAQTTTQRPPPPQIPELNLDSALNVIGCSGIGASSQGRFTVSTIHRNLYYRWLTKGLEGWDYRGVHVVGALLPTTDIAAQAGYINPTYTAAVTAAGNYVPVGPIHVHVRFEPVPSATGSCHAP